MRIEHPHECGVTHRTVQALAWCMWSHEQPLVTGDGTIAVVAHCGTTDIALFPTLAQAKRRLRRLDDVGCGERCVGDHELHIVLAESAEASRVV